jgi:hypothetical protein
MDVFYLILKFMDEKQTFTKIEGPKMDFFLPTLMASKEGRVKWPF